MRRDVRLMIGATIGRRPASAPLRFPGFFDAQDHAARFSAKASLRRETAALFRQRGRYAA
jgi:hypothetical protein